MGPHLRLRAEKPYGHGDPWSLEKLDEHRREVKAGSRVAVEDVGRKGLPGAKTDMNGSLVGRVESGLQALLGEGTARPRRRELPRAGSVGLLLTGLRVGGADSSSLGQHRKLPRAFPGYPRVRGREGFSRRVSSWATR